MTRLSGSLRFDALRKPPNRSWAVLSGALFNRAALTTRLASPAAPLDEAQLILALHANHGEEFLKLLIGEYVVALWDADQQVFLAARDPLGVRPFYYCYSENMLWFDSDLTALACALDTDEWDEETIAFALASDWSLQDRTFYRRIRKLPPGHFLRWTSEGLSIERYWNLEPGAEIRFARREDYVAALREMLEEAVRCRLAAYSRAGIFLSGGFDSSSLTALALRANPGAFETFSIVSENPCCDNRAAIDLFSPIGQWPRHRIMLEEHWNDYASVPSADFGDTLYSPNLFLFRPLLREAARKELKVVFTGAGGDEVFTPPPALCADFLRRRQWRSLVDELRHGQLSDIPIPRAFWRFAVKPLAPTRWTTWMRRLVSRRAPAPLSASAARRWRIMDRIASHYLQVPSGCRSAYQKAFYIRMLGWGGRGATFELEQKLASLYGLAFSYPLFDIRLVEYLFQVPVDELKGHGWNKFLFRQAMGGILPDELLFRNDRQEYTPVIFGALQRQFQTFEDWARHSLLAKRGLVDPISAASLWERRQQPKARAELMKFLAMENWARYCGQRRQGEKEKRQERLPAVAQSL